jgi:hypothetical protein
MTPLRKAVTRRSEELMRDRSKYRRIVVTLYPAGFIGLRLEKCRRQETLSIRGAYETAVQSASCASAPSAVRTSPSLPGAAASDAPAQKARGRPSAGEPGRLERATAGIAPGCPGGPSPLPETHPMSCARTAARFDFRKRVAYDPEAKRLFHAQARRQLLELAATLGFAPCAFDLRSNAGGIAVSGEVTLHTDRLYVQVCQPATGSDTGILFRSCEHRRDYIGGVNNFASLDLLHRPAELARRIRLAGLA